MRQIDPCLLFFSGYIIAILAAILFPVFAKAREKARQSSCLSNMKQLALGNLQYAQDYDERTLPYSTLPSGVGYMWFELVQPYLKSVQILKCPSQNPTVLTQTRSLAVSYGLTRSSGCLGEGGEQGVALGRIAQPAETYCMMDTRANDDEAQTFGTFYAPPGNTWGSYGTMSPRHNEGANIGFYDGHAKWMSRQAAWAMPYYDFN
ncbi:MAG: DUF1559 domain-containing protein [Armatimonadia bacterium]